jgi:hypothetical protein
MDQPNSTKLLIVNNLSELLSFMCVWPGMPTGPEGDWLMEARIQANIATQNFLLGRIDTEEFLDRVEFTGSVNMDEYLMEVEDSVIQAQEWLTSLNNG